MNRQKQRRLEKLRRLRSDLFLFSEDCLKIKTKERTIVPLVFNKAQRYAHARLQDQLKNTASVRALVLKGRQQGVSTYVAARFYQRSSLWTATNVYILTHEQKATDALFGMVDRYHEHNPLAPSVGKNNAKELVFDTLDSSYTVATAGQKAGGRSRTSSLFHGSEVAFWANAPDHFAASVQTVPDMPGTEVILESTANGPLGEFYERWQESEAGENNYMTIFIPWFWQEEYAFPVPPGFKLSDEAEEGEMSELEYFDLFNLSLEQMVWRRDKIQVLRSPALFDQEYPGTAQMAFVTPTLKSYISALDVLRARKRKVLGGGPLIMGADPAGAGGDRFSICGRRGNCVEYLKWRNKLETADAYHWCKDVILKHKPARFNVDAGGIGAAVLSLLRNDEDIPKGVVVGINFGGKSQAKMGRPDVPGPKNRRAEMWTRMKDWFGGEEPVSVPDLDVLQSDLVSVWLKPTLTNDILLVSKEEMRSKGIRSPDIGDSLALTFASATLIKNYVDKLKQKQEYGVPETAPAPRFGRVGVGSDSWMG